MNPALTKQYIMFHQALQEKHGKVKDDEIQIDHAEGSCTYMGVKHGIIFPRAYIDYTDKHSKQHDYVFIGKHTKGREWVREYEDCDCIMDFTRRGREMETKHAIDTAYYDAMLSAKYALCPAGAFEWTYRAYEALMCYCIPVFLSAPTFHDFNTRYYYQLHGHPHEYSVSAALENRAAFIDRHTL